MFAKLLEVKGRTLIFINNRNIYYETSMRIASHKGKWLLVRVPYGHLKTNYTHMKRAMRKFLTKENRRSA